MKIIPDGGTACNLCKVSSEVICPMLLAGGQILRVYLPLIYFFLPQRNCVHWKSNNFCWYSLQSLRARSSLTASPIHISLATAQVGWANCLLARSMHSFQRKREGGSDSFRFTPLLILIAELACSSKTGWKSSSGLGKRSMHSFQRGRGRGACGELNEILALPIWTGGPPIKLKAI